MKEKKKFIRISIITILIICIVFSIFYIKRRNNYIILTEFSPCSARQMMGYAIKTINGKIIIIDGGTTDDAEQLEKYIVDNGSKVDAWFITHLHSDHAGAFEIISQNENIDIEKIYMSVNDKQWYIENEPSRQEDIDMFFPVIEQERKKEKIVEPQINDTIRIDNVTAKILGIKNPEITTNSINNSSMVIKFAVNQKDILFLGDTGTESSEKLIKNQGKNLRADIVQVAHHGQAGAPEELYKIVKPEICLWPTTQRIWENNMYGTEDDGPWKTKETRKWMENLKVKVNYLAFNGVQNIKIF